MRAAGRRFWTDYPVTGLGDVANQRAPIRRVKVLVNGEKWVTAQTECGCTFEVKRCYLHPRRRAIRR